MPLPNISRAECILPQGYQDRCLIISEGFEERSLSWISKQPNEILFQDTIVCKYDPEQVGKFQEMVNAVSSRTATSPVILNYNRFAPADFERAFCELVDELMKYSELVIDISVMSKMLILIIFNALRKFNGNIRIIYTEPVSWSPTEEEYQKKVSSIESSPFIALSSVGVYDVIKTPKLSSVVMQDAQTLLIAFTSTNNHLINALLNTINPSLTLLINAKSRREAWREQAAIDINKNVFNDFPMYTKKIPSYGLLDYQGVFEFLADIYRQNCYCRRLIISPTGGKIHAIACAIIKGCCSDIHIEYPTPETYLFTNFSSKEILEIHEIVFQSYCTTIDGLAVEYGLNG